MSVPFAAPADGAAVPDDSARSVFRVMAAIAMAFGVCALAGCASPTGSTSMPTEAAAAEDAEPLPPGIKPLTVEQEENVSATQ